MPSPSAADQQDFFDLYFQYVGKTEAPRLFHRWCAIASVAALLGRQCWLPFGHWTIYPNMYVMLMGSPGTRKSTAIMISRKMIERQGYDRFSADRTSAERFLYDLLRHESIESVEELTEMNLDALICERFIVADEFTDFVGKGNLNFLTMLAKLWDAPDSYEHPKLHGTSIIVPRPTVSAVTGNTPTNFMIAFPPEAIGQGLMSRIILVHGDATGEKIEDPPAPTEESIKALQSRLTQMRKVVRGPMKKSPETQELFGKIYKSFKDIEDHRFQHYSTRRFTHFQKLAMVIAAMRCSTVIDKNDCLVANTILHYTETRMPKALGEFGKSRNADVANNILEILKRVKRPVTVRYLWKMVAQDLNRQEELIELVKNLREAGKIQLVAGADNKSGYVPNYETAHKWDSSLILEDYLTEEEKA